MERIYACIDLKSFYASVECMERGLDPLTTNLVVADKGRTEKTICLAVSPSLKSYGLSGRSRLYEVVSRVKQVNNDRKRKINYKPFIGKSSDNNKVRLNPYIELDYIVAPPRMALYMKYSTNIYNTYLEFLSEEDIFAYSIDEVFCDITNYLKYYKMKPEQLLTKMILEVYKKTGITATGGIGTNLYLAKIAMDIMAKKTQPNKNGVRIFYLDEYLYRKLLWNHEPLTDFWRVGKGYSQKLIENKIYTMGDICRVSLDNEAKLYKMFGVNAELLIDHAWGYEVCTIKDVKSFRPLTNSLSRGQVLHEPEEYNKTKLIVREMVDDLVLEMIDKNYTTNQITLTIGYDNSNMNNNYNGDTMKDHYGRIVPKHGHGTENIDHYTASTKIIMEHTMNLFERIINYNLLVRRINLSFNNLITIDKASEITNYEQMDLFSNIDKKINKQEENNELKVQKAVIQIKKKYGKNAILKGMNYVEGATMRERNKFIGGHHE